MSLSPADLVLILLYFVAIQLAGFVIARRRAKTDAAGDSRVEFILAGRRLTLPLFVMTLVATFYGAILGVGEFIYSGGVVAWICFMLPYYISSFLFALFLARRVRSSEHVTIPEQIGASLGRGPARVAAFLVLIITIPASYLLTVGVLVELITGWERWLCVVLAAVFSLSYLLVGGLRGGVYTDVLQFMLMYLGFALLLWFTVDFYGPPGRMLHDLPASHLDPTGGFSWQYLLVWYMLALFTFVDPTFHQRCAAAKDARTARNGIFVSMGFWVVFDTLVLLCGLYARAYIVTDDPLASLPLLGDAVLPSVVKGLFVVGLLSTVMSTLDSLGFISGVTIGNDLLRPLRAENSDADATRLSRIGIAIAAFFAVALALMGESVVSLLYLTASVAIPGLLFPLLLSFSSRWSLRPGISAPLMLTASGVSLGWIVLTRLAADALPVWLAATEPMYPGLLTALLFLAAGLVRRPHVLPQGR